MRIRQKKNHNRVRSIYVIKIDVPLYVKKLNFFGLRTINFHSRIRVLRAEFHKTFKKLAVGALSGFKYYLKNTLIIYEENTKDFASQLVCCKLDTQY